MSNIEKQTSPPGLRDGQKTVSQLTVFIRCVNNSWLIIEAQETSDLVAGHFKKNTTRLLPDTETRFLPESLHPESPLEWWFVHGCFEGSHVEKRYFMISLFRHDVPRKSRASEPTYSLLLSVLYGRSGRHETAHWVDPTLVNSLIHAPEETLQINLDRRFRDLYLQELRQYRSFRNVEFLSSEPRIKADPLHLQWKDFSLKQREEGFVLVFKEPHARRPSAFRLCPQGPRLDIEAARQMKSSLGSMSYFSYPRLVLTGTAGGHPVSGKAWLDHQWGGYGWLAENANSRKAMGWDWFGINLDDGSDMTVMTHRDPQTKKIFGRYVTRRDRRGIVTTYKDFTLSPRRIWQSPRTAVSYPIEWDISIPDLEASLVFTPLADDQEIPVLGLVRAVWEGAGKVAGKIAARAVEGNARCELHGYGYIYDFRAYLKAISKRIDRHIKDFLPRKITEKKLRTYVGPPFWKYEPSAYTDMLSKPVWDLVSRGGKRWRPILALLLLEAMGRDPAPFESMICVLAELCHTGALIIDDIEDSSRLRRGDTCIHLRYGLDLSINAANTLYYLPSLLIFNHPHLSERQRLAIHEVMTRQYVRAHFGQALDLFWSRQMNEKNLRGWMRNSLADKILQMYEFKTAAPIEACAETAAIVAEAPSTTRRAAWHFASGLGVAFQILDDVRNFTDGADKKKVPGEDLSKGKLTYVLFRAIENLRPAGRKKLLEILASQSLRQDPSVHREGIDLIQESGALELCQREAERLAHSGWRELAKMLPPSESKILLQTLYLSLLDLNYKIKL